MSKTFRKPNLEAQTGGLGREPYISVRTDGASLGISRAARKKYGAEKGRYLHFALDRTGAPWVAFLDEKTDQGEPQIRRDGKQGHGAVINSTLLSRHLREIAGATGNLDSSLRFYFTGETAEDPDTGATLHRLEVPDVG